MAKYLVGIDIGTTGSRCCIFDLKGNLLGSGYREYCCIYPKPNWIDQDGDLLLTQTYDACKTALKTSGIEPKEIATIAFSTQRSVFGPVGKDGKPVRNFISWQDNRGHIEVEEMQEKITPEEYYKITGLPVGATTWIISKLLWYRKNEPENYEKTAVFTQNQDYFLKAFGADDYYVDVSDGPFFGVFDVDKAEYSEKLLNLFDIPREKLPKLTKPGTMVGRITKDVAQATGFAEGTPICVGAGDQNCALVGAGVVKAGLASITLGTAGLGIAFSPEPVRDPNGNMMITGHAGTGKWQVEGISLAAASCYRWYRGTFCEMEETNAEKLNKDPYDLINEQIAGVPPGAKGVVFLPYLASAGTPRYNPDARGTFLGLTFAHKKADIARAVMEGICLEMRDIIQAQKACGLDIEKYRLT
ncbi:MAG: FGGY-family carbohydrate kinase, partial [Bacillota bacterium]